MEESKILLELKFISALALTELMKLLCSETESSVSLCFSHPLFSCVVTFCTLILLYLPRLFRKILLSPILILAGILFLAVLRFGATQRSQNEQSNPKKCLNNEDGVEAGEASSPEQFRRCVAGNSTEESDSEMGFDFHSESFEESNVKAKMEVIHEENRGSEEEKEKVNSLLQIHQWIAIQPETEPNPDCKFGSDSWFVEWNVRAPLEVIYEGEEEEGEAEDKIEHVGTRLVGFSGYPSDSDSSSELGFPAEKVCFMWDEEEREGLIEIAIEGCYGKKIRGMMEFQFEEENLIEIDISPARYSDFSGEISCN